MSKSYLLSRAPRFDPSIFSNNFGQPFCDKKLFLSRYEVLPNQIIDIDAVLYQEGYNMLHLLVESGDTFKIEREHIDATFQCNGNSVCLFSDHPAFDEIVDEDNIGLESGRYKLSDDGKSIERLDFDDDDIY